LAVDNLYLPHDFLKSTYDTARGLGAQLITTHGVSGAQFNNAPSAIQMLAQHGLLGPDVLVSHATVPKAEDPDLLKEHGGFISSTPNTEMQMGTSPIALRPEFQGHGSIGVDCHSWGGSFIPGQMRTLLLQARYEIGAALEKDTKWGRHVGPTVEEVFNLGTIGGARAVGMADSIGKIAVGMKADLVVFGTESPSMLAAALEDPLAAIVMHASERDVEMVLVDGVVRKEDGALKAVEGAGEIAGAPALGFAGRNIPWSEVAREILVSRQGLKEKFKVMDPTAIEENIIDMMHMSRENMVE
jgi:cytosine/adenosine deaminase-related metal-dependent hydrolase